MLLVVDFVVFDSVGGVVVVVGVGLGVVILLLIVVLVGCVGMVGDDLVGVVFGCFYDGLVVVLV